MTGREYIQYILENHLEDEEIISDGKILGFLSKLEAAKKFNTGLATINAWTNAGYLKEVYISETVLIPETATVRVPDINLRGD